MPRSGVTCQSCDLIRAGLGSAQINAPPRRPAGVTHPGPGLTALHVLYHGGFRAQTPNPPFAVIWRSRGGFGVVVGWWDAPGRFRPASRRAAAGAVGGRWIWWRGPPDRDTCWLLRRETCLFSLDCAVYLGYRILGWLARCQRYSRDDSPVFPGRSLKARGWGAAGMARWAGAAG